MSSFKEFLIETFSTAEMILLSYSFFPFCIFSFMQPIIRKIKSDHVLNFVLLCFSLYTEINSQNTYKLVTMTFCQ